MKDKKYTISFRYKVHPLLLGGYSPAKIISYKKNNKNPVVLKSYN